MSKFCQNCGTALTEDTRFCPGCGTPVVQAPQAQPAQAPQQQPPRQPQQPVYQQPQQRVPAPPQYAPNAAKARKSAPAKKKKGKGGLVAVIAILLVAVIGVVGFFGLRDGGFLRGGNTGKTVVDPAKRTGTDTAAMLEYAKRLEKMGNLEAAAEIYAKLQEAGQADMNEAAQYYRDDPRRLMLDALSDEDLYDALTQKGRETE